MGYSTWGHQESDTAEHTQAACEDAASAVAVSARACSSTGPKEGALPDSA